jgi:hypothetical protein
MDIGWQLARGGEYVEQHGSEGILKGKTQKLDLQVASNRWIL